MLSAGVGDQTPTAARVPVRPLAGTRLPQPPYDTPSGLAAEDSGRDPESLACTDDLPFKQDGVAGTPRSSPDQNVVVTRNRAAGESPVGPAGAVLWQRTSGPGMAPP